MENHTAGSTLDGSRSTEAGVLICWNEELGGGRRRDKKAGERVLVLNNLFIRSTGSKYYFLFVLKLRDLTLFFLTSIPLSCTLNSSLERFIIDLQGYQRYATHIAILTTQYNLWACKAFAKRNDGHCILFLPGSLTTLQVFIYLFST